LKLSLLRAYSMVSARLGSSTCIFRPATTTDVATERNADWLIHQTAYSRPVAVHYGHYPTSTTNHNLDTPGTNHFNINLQAPPFNLKPDEILVETEQVFSSGDRAKHLAVFKKGSLMA